MYTVYQKALAHFKKNDPKLHTLAEGIVIPDIVAAGDMFRDIVWTIIGQQLSGKAADTIFERFAALFPDSKVVPEHISKLADADLRSCGLSGAKTRAIRDLASKVLSGELDLARLPSLPDVDVIIELTRVKGIGPWTAEMILMFSLGRTDVFSMGDLVLKKEIMSLYGWKKLPSQKKIDTVLAAWSPYRTYAAKILWKVADAKKNRIPRKR
ncbi:MAG TPA: DNA-3-methyladenine glycosylase [Candidatus Paceibacterota bacterium]|nr:DNA-3-methyladenine glycosylase [Candidatus Paceibacterota bacterium]